MLFTKLLANDSITIKEYLSMISNDLEMTFVLNDDIDESFNLMIPQEIPLADHLKILVQVLKEHNLTIKPVSSFFVISKIKSEDDEKKRTSIC